MDIHELLCIHLQSPFQSLSRHCCSRVIFFLLATLFSFSHILQSATSLSLDPSDLFLKGYQEFQNAEALERQNIPHKAIDKYRYAANILSEIQKTHSTWQPLVVKYRLQKIWENIARLELLPPSLLGAPADSAQSIPHRFLLTRFRSPPSLVITAAQENFSSSLDSMTEIQKLHGQLRQAIQENKRLNTEIATAQAEKKCALVEIDKMKVSLVEAKSQNFHTENTKNILREKTQHIDQLEKMYTARFSSLEERLNTMAADNTVLSEENERIFKKLEQAAIYIRSSDEIRKGLIKDRVRLSHAEQIARKKLQQMKDSNQLLEKLQNTHKESLAKISDISQKLTYSEKATEQANIHAQNADAKIKKLLDQNSLLSKKIASLSEELIHTKEKLEKEKNQLASRLEIELENTAHLITQLQSEKNKNLQKETNKLLKTTPEASSDTEVTSLTASVSIVKKTDPSTPATPHPNPQLVSVKPPPPSNSTLTPEEASLAKLAESAFKEGKFADSETLFKRIVEKNPTHISILANLGAVQSQLGKYTAAENALHKALVLNPSYPFAIATLGILQLKCARVDDAIETLKNSIRLDSQNASAHNYLGIAYGETGHLEEAEKALKTAIQLNPNYAIAHFNLAVLYSTQKIPNKELARKHYLLSTHLGAAPDATLERLIQY